MEQLSHENAYEKITALERRLNKERQGKGRRTHDAALRASFSFMSSLDTAGIPLPGGKRGEQERSSSSG
jgi:hypothetical protein